MLSRAIDVIAFAPALILAMWHAWDWIERELIGRGWDED